MRELAADAAGGAVPAGNAVVGGKRTAGASALVVVACVLWTAAVGAGLAAFWRYETTPGPPSDAPLAWPRDSTIPRVPGRATLVMLAHPRCACTRASLRELGHVLDEVHVPLTAYVLFVKPAGAPAGWDDTGTWTRAHDLPGVTVLRDDDGREAERFHALTSGQTVVYDAGGRLVFHGGVTAARGQEGDSIGRRRLVALLQGAPADGRESDVYGCALHDPPAPPEERSRIPGTTDQ